MTDYSDVFDQVTTTNEQAKQNLTRAAGMNPAVAAQASQLAKRMGVGPEAISLDPDTFKQTDERQGQDTVVEDNPVVRDYVAADPYNAAVSKEDLDNLGHFANIAIGAGKKFIDDTGAMVDAGFHQNELNKQIFADKMSGNYSADKYKDQEAYIHSLRNPEGLSFGAETIGGFIGSTMNALKSVTKGAAAGAAIGSVAGGVGALPGAAAGAVAGFGADMAMAAFGQVYRAADGFRDESGQPIPESGKLVAASLAGVLNGVLGSVGGGKVSELYGPLITSTITKLATSSSTSQLLARAGAQVAESGLTMGALNASMGMGSELIQEAAKHLAPGEVESMFNNKEAFTGWLAHGLESALSGFALGTVLAVPAAGKNFLVDRARVEQYKLDAAQIQQTWDALQKVKTAALDPQRFEDEVVNKQLGLAPVRIDAEGVAALQEQGLAGFIDPAKVAEAQAHGGDVEVDAGKFYKLENADSFEALLPHIRTDSGLTQIEAQTLAARPFESYGEVQVVPGLFENANQTGVEIPTDILGNPQSILIANETHDAIQEWRDNLYLGNIFDPNAAGMNKPMFEKFSKAVQEQQKEMTKAALDAAEKEIKRRETKLWKANRAEELQGAEKDIGERPDFVAENWLRDKEFGYRLDPKEIDALFDEADFARLGIGKPPSQILPEEFFAKGGVDKSGVDLAATAGYSDVKSMVEGLLKLQQERESTGWNAKRQFDETVAAEADKRMNDKYGSLEDRVMNEALEAAISVKQLKVMIDEFNLMAGDERLTLDQVRDFAEKLHGKMDAKRGADINEFSRLVTKYGEQARLLQFTDPAKALMAMQRRAYNLALMQEAKAFQREKVTGDTLIKKYSDNIQIGAGDLAKERQPFTDMAHVLLAEHGLNVPGGIDRLNEQTKGTTLTDFIREKAQPPFNIDIPLYDITRAKLPAERFKVDDYREFQNTLKSLDFNGRREGQLQVGTKQLILSHELATLKQNLADLEGSGPSEKTIAHMVRGADAMLVKMEQLFDWIDQSNPHGVLSQGVVRPLKEGLHLREDLRKDLADGFKQAAKANEWSRKLDEQVKNDYLTDARGRPMKLNFEKLITIALNMGNEGNKARLLQGRNWDEGTVMQVLNDNLKPQDVKRIADIWKTIDGLWPHLKGAVEESSGLTPPKVKGSELTIAGEKVKGGYYPLIRDTLESRVKMEESPDAKTLYDPFASANAFKTRTKAVYPVDLTLGSLENVLRETTHAIAMHSPVREAWKILNSDEMKQGLIDSYGPEYWQQVRPWITDVANDGARFDASGVRMAEGFFSKLRVNTVALMIGFRPDTAAIHGGAAMANSVGEFLQSKGDLKYLAGAMRDFLTDWPGTVKMMNEMSGEMRHRGNNMDRDLSTQLMNLKGESLLRKRAMVAGSYMVRALDQASSAIVWKASYDRAIARGEMPEDANFIAEKVIRQTHGSGSVFDQAAIQRGSEFQKWGTMFYSVFNHNYNRLRDIGVKTGEAWETKNGALAFAQFVRGASYLIVPAMIHEWLRGEKKEDDSFLGFGARAVLTQGFSTVPWVRDIWHGLAHDQDIRANPLADAFTAATKPLDDIDKWRNGELEESEVVRHLMEAASAMTGVGSKYTAGWAQEIFDQFSNNPRSYDEKDWARFFWQGRSKPKTEH